MNRTLGFFLGSAAVFGLLLLLLGRPVSLAPPMDRNPVLKSASTAPIQIPEAILVRQTPPLPDAGDRVGARPPAADLPQQLPSPESATASADSPHGDAQSTPEPEQDPVEPAAVPGQSADEMALVENWLSSMPALPDGDAGDVPASQLEWFPVWDPFHSELSANAFARRLERLTGLDYRVVKTGATEYRVTMGYASEEQRLINLAMIEEATGLSITGGSR